LRIIAGGTARDQAGRAKPAADVLANAAV